MEKFYWNSVRIIIRPQIYYKHFKIFKEFQIFKDYFIQNF